MIKVVHFNNASQNAASQKEIIQFKAHNSAVAALKLS
jgi:hypothetical protein